MLTEILHNLTPCQFTASGDWLREHKWGLKKLFIKAVAVSVVMLVPLLKWRLKKVRRLMHAICMIKCGSCLVVKYAPSYLNYAKQFKKWKKYIWDQPCGNGLGLKTLKNIISFEKLSGCLDICFSKMQLIWGLFYLSTKLWTHLEWM